MMEGEDCFFGLILEKVFQQARGGRVTEKWPVVFFSGEKCHFIERTTATRKCPTVTATAA